MTARFVERNAALLKKRGLPVTASTIYLAHFAGGPGAVAILSADENADAAWVMAKADAKGRIKRDQIIKANPFLQHFSVSDLKRWANRKMQGPRLNLVKLADGAANWRRYLRACNIKELGCLPPPRRECTQHSACNRNLCRKMCDFCRGLISVCLVPPQRYQHRTTT
jgi:hypothetical protein